MAKCEHLNNLEIKAPDIELCLACEKSGNSWGHLRKCQTLCCDSSPNKHATRHAQETGHPVVVSAEPSEYWAYCYPDQSFTQINKLW